MTLGGWITMALSVGFVTGLLVWCLGRIVRHPEAAQHLHPPADLEPHEPSPPPSEQEPPS